MNIQGKVTIELAAFRNLEKSRDKYHNFYIGINEIVNDKNFSGIQKMKQIETIVKKHKEEL